MGVTQKLFGQIVSFALLCDNAIAFSKQVKFIDIIVAVCDRENES